MGRLRVMLGQATLVGFIFNASLAKAASNHFSPTLLEGESTSVPFGWLNFCHSNSNPAECQPNRSEAPTKIDFTPYIYGLLNEITSQVNAEIKPVSDFDHYGVEDFWTYPSDGKGDCEDVALEKRRRLIEKGIPPEALSLAVVKMKTGGHVILIIRTELGDFALDNLTNEVMFWYETGHEFVKYQSPQDPSLWISAKAGQPPKVMASQTIRTDKKGGKPPVTRLRESSRTVK